MTAQRGEWAGVAVSLVEQGYQELGFWYPVLRLRELGADVFIAGPSAEETYRSQLGYPVIPDGDLAAAAARQPDVLIVPGGDPGRLLTASAAFRDLAAAHRARGQIVAVIGEPGDVSGDICCATPDELPALVPALLQALRDE
jgi:protease I